MDDNGQTRFFESPEIKDLAAALAKAQGEFPPIKKDKTATVKPKDGAGYNYSYSDIGDVLDAIRPILSKHEIAVTQPTLFNARGQFVLLTRLIHSSGQWMACEWALPSQVGPQQLGSALTYGRRYSLQTLVGVAPELDDDGKAAADTRPDKPAPRQQPRQVQRPTASASPRPSEPSPPHDPDTGVIQDEPIPGDETQDIASPWYIDPDNGRGGMAWTRFIESFGIVIDETKSLDDLRDLQSANQMTLSRLREQNGRGQAAYDKLLSRIAERRAALASTILAAG